MSNGINAGAYELTLRQRFEKCQDLMNPATRELLDTITALRERITELENRPVATAEQLMDHIDKVANRMCKSEELKKVEHERDELRARVAELESEPTDTEIAEWIKRLDGLWAQRRRQAQPAKDAGRVEPADDSAHVNHRNVAVNLLSDTLDRAADSGHPGWIFEPLAGEIVDAILRAARGGAT